MDDNITLIKSLYPCQAVPVVVLKQRCPRPCLYCDLYHRKFRQEQVLAIGRDNVLNKLGDYKGAYFSAVTDCFLLANQADTHYLLENIWWLKKNFVPLIVTKQIIPDKTIELLVNNKDRVVVQISFPTIDPGLASIVEPGAASLADRLAITKRLSRQGVLVTAVVMPWLDLCGPDIKIVKLAESLSAAGINRAILGLGVLPPEQKIKMLNTKNLVIQGMIERMTQNKKVTTKTGDVLPIKERIHVFAKLIKVFGSFNIQARVCTADNPDLTVDSGLRLCSKFKHPLFNH